MLFSSPLPKGACARSLVLELLPGRVVKVPLPWQLFVGNVSLSHLCMEHLGLQLVWPLRGQRWCPLGEDTLRFLSPKTQLLQVISCSWWAAR